MANRSLASIEPFSIPPITSDPSLPGVSPDMLPHPSNPNALMQTMRVPLRKGIICQVNMDRPWLLQNVNENEDDKIEFSIHGEVDGTWNRMHIGTSVKAAASMFFLNRTDKDVLYMAIFPQ